MWRHSDLHKKTEALRHRQRPQTIAHVCGLKSSIVGVLSESGSAVRRPLPVLCLLSMSHVVSATVQQEATQVHPSVGQGAPLSKCTKMRPK